jgi:hypothetical protein
MPAISSVNSPRIIDQNLSIFPNPTSSSATITYSLPSSEKITLIVYDALGREAAVPVFDQLQSEGAHEIMVNTLELAPGIYTCCLKTGKGNESNKVVIIR